MLKMSGTPWDFEKISEILEISGKPWVQYFLDEYSVQSLVSSGYSKVSEDCRESNRDFGNIF